MTTRRRRGHRASTPILGGRSFLVSENLVNALLAKRRIEGRCNRAGRFGI